MEIVLGFLLLIVALVIAIKIFGFAIWLLWTLLAGLAVGALARLILPGEQKMNLPATALYGVAGSFIGKLVGGWLFSFGWLLTLILSVACATILIAATVDTKH